MQARSSHKPFEGYFIPFSAHIDEKTIISKSGLISQTIKIKPSPHSQFKNNIIAALKHLITPDTLINIHTLHLNATKLTYQSFEDYLCFSQIRHLAPHNEYEHEFYITISIPGCKIDKSSIGNFLLSSRFLMEVNKNAAILNKKVIKFCKNIEQYSPTTLSTYTHKDITYSYNSAFLYKLLFLSNTHIPISDIETSEQIKPSSIQIQKNSLIVHRGKEKKYITCLTIKDFPHVNDADIIKIFTSKHPFTLSQTIHHARNNEIHPLFEYQSRTTSALRGNKIANMTSWNEILAEQNPIAMQTNITLHANTAQELENYVAEASSTLANIGIVAIREDINLEQSFYTTLPSNSAFLNRIEYGTLMHAGQFLLAKNMLFYGMNAIQHLPFMPLIATNNKYYAISPFAINKTEHILIAGTANQQLYTFLNTFILNTSKETKITCLDSHHSSVVLNKLNKGIYLTDLHVNILNLLKLSSKHFFTFFSHLVRFFFKQKRIKITQEAKKALKEFYFKLKPKMQFAEIRSLTRNRNIIALLDFANQHNFFCKSDIFETQHRFISINTDKIPTSMYTLKALYTMLANLCYSKETHRNILKLDKTFECFDTNIITEDLMKKILLESKIKNISIIACTNIPQSFEKNRQFIYSDIFPQFNTSIFMESECSTDFIKQFFQLNSQTIKQLMFIKSGAEKAVINNNGNVFTIKLKENIPWNLLTTLTPMDTRSKAILKIIENNKSQDSLLVKQCIQLINNSI